MNPITLLKPKNSPDWLKYIVISALCALLAGCNGNIVSSSNPASTSGANNVNIGTGAQGLQVFVEPAAGESVITSAIQGAKQSVWLEIYLLTDTKVLNALEEAAHRGLDVRVMLETHPYGSGNGPSPRQTLDRLKAAGVKAQATSPIFALTHEKGLLIDNSNAFIMTSNFTRSALGGSGGTINREYGIIDNNQQDVQAVMAIFNADWQHTNAQFNAPNLVVSPENSRDAFTALINGAQRSLAVEAEEMQDSDIEQALVNATKRGVQVQVILPTPGNGSSDSNGQGISTIKQGSVQIKEDGKLYMHAKIIIVDGRKAFVGSENISTASLNRNRELGVIVADPGVINTLQQTFQQDWGDSQAT